MLRKTHLDQIEQHQRHIYAGSAHARVASLTDDDLRRVAVDPAFLAWERDPNGHHTFSAGSIESAAAAELTWRQNVGLSFGWTAV